MQGISVKFYLTQLKAFIVKVESAGGKKGELKYATYTQDVIENTHRKNGAFPLCHDVIENKCLMSCRPGCL